MQILRANQTLWKQRKKGIDNIYKIVRKLKIEYSEDYATMSLKLKEWYKGLSDSDDSKRHQHYSNIDSKGVYFPSDISWPGGGGPKYEVLHPITKLPCKIPARGWKYPNFERMNECINLGLVHFGDDEKSVPCGKTHLSENEFQTPYSIIYQDSRAAMKRLRNIMLEKVFDNPKDENIISDLLQFSSTSKAIILDFFAGSGTTLHATMQLNAEDGGNRQCILVTNNENNICEEVTYERNKRVIRGYTNAKGAQVPGLTNNNLRYYKTGFVPSAKTEVNRRLLTSASTELLQIKEDCYNDITSASGFDASRCCICTNGRGKYLVVVYHSRLQHEVVGQLCLFIQNIAFLTEKVRVYAFSPETEVLVEDFYAVADKINAVPLPDAIYNAYRATFKTLRLEKKNYRNTAPVAEQEAVPENAASENQTVLFNQNGEEQA